MKLLQVSDVYFPRINGVSTSIEGSARELRRLGHRVDLLVPRYGDEPAGAGALRVPSLVVPFDREDRLMPPRRDRAARAAGSSEPDAAGRRLTALEGPT